MIMAAASLALGAVRPAGKCRRFFKIICANMLTKSENMALWRERENVGDACRAAQCLLLPRN